MKKLLSFLIIAFCLTVVWISSGAKMIRALAYTQTAENIDSQSETTYNSSERELVTTVTTDRYSGEMSTASKAGIIALMVVSNIAIIAQKVHDKKSNK